MFDPKTLLEQGWAALGNHQPEGACDLFAQAVAEARFVHEPALLTSALMALGHTEYSLQHPARALDCYREAAALCEHSGHPAAQAAALIEVAEILHAQNRMPEAETICEQLLAVPQLAEDDAPLPRARALHMLALCREASAGLEEITLLLQAAATLYEAAGARDRTAECKSHLAFLQGC